MENHETIIAIFDARGSADDAIKRLISASFTMNQLSVIGKGYHTEENVAGFYCPPELVFGTLGAAVVFAVVLDAISMPLFSKLAIA